MLLSEIQTTSCDDFYAGLNVSEYLPVFSAAKAKLPHSRIIKSVANRNTDVD